MFSQSTLSSSTRDGSPLIRRTAGVPVSSRSSPLVNTVKRPGAVTSAAVVPSSISGGPVYGSRSGTPTQPSRYAPISSVRNPVASSSHRAHTPTRRQQPDGTSTTTGVTSTSLTGSYASASSRAGTPSRLDAGGGTAAFASTNPSAAAAGRSSSSSLASPIPFEGTESVTLLKSLLQEHRELISTMRRDFATREASYNGTISQLMSALEEAEKRADASKPSSPVTPPSISVTNSDGSSSRAATTNGGRKTDSSLRSVEEENAETYRLKVESLESELKQLRSEKDALHSRVETLRRQQLTRAKNGMDILVSGMEAVADAHYQSLVAVFSAAQVAMLLETLKRQSEQSALPVDASASSNRIPTESVQEPRFTNVTSASRSLVGIGERSGQVGSAPQLGDNGPIVSTTLIQPFTLSMTSNEAHLFITISVEELLEEIHRRYDAQSGAGQMPLKQGGRESPSSQSAQQRRNEANSMLEGAKEIYLGEVRALDAAMASGSSASAKGDYEGIVDAWNNCIALPMSRWLSLPLPAMDRITTQGDGGSGWEADGEQAAIACGRVRHHLQCKEAFQWWQQNQRHGYSQGSTASRSVSVEQSSLSASAAGVPPVAAMSSESLSSQAGPDMTIRRRRSSLEKEASGPRSPLPSPLSVRQLSERAEMGSVRPSAFGTNTVNGGIDSSRAAKDADETSVAAIPSPTVTSPSPIRKPKMSEKDIAKFLAKRGVVLDAQQPDGGGRGTIVKGNGTLKVRSPSKNGNQGFSTQNSPQGQRRRGSAPMSPPTSPLLGASLAVPGGGRGNGTVKKKVSSAAMRAQLAALKANPALAAAVLNGVPNNNGGGGGGGTQHGTMSGVTFALPDAYDANSSGSDDDDDDVLYEEDDFSFRSSRQEVLRRAQNRAQGAVSAFRYLGHDHMDSEHVLSQTTTADMTFGVFNGSMLSSGDENEKSMSMSAGRRSSASQGDVMSDDNSSFTILVNGEDVGCEGSVSQSSYY